VSGGGSRGGPASEKKCRETVALWPTGVEGTSEKERTGYGKHASVYSNGRGGGFERVEREGEPKKNRIRKSNNHRRAAEKNDGKKRVIYKNNIVGARTDANTVFTVSPRPLHGNSRRYPVHTCACTGAPVRAATAPPSKPQVKSGASGGPRWNK